MNNATLAATAAAATESALLDAKAAIRQLADIDPVRAHQLCRLLDNVYAVGFTSGAAWMGEQALDTFRA